MSKEKLYYQCDLSNDTGRDKAYIEEKGAVVGKHVELGGKGTDDFWVVTSVADKPLTETQLKAIQDDHHKGFLSIK